MRDVETLLSIYRDVVYYKTLLGPVPTTVDVPYTTIVDPKLPMQKILPESTLEEFIPNYHD
jgi:hypothetical protein